MIKKTRKKKHQKVDTSEAEGEIEDLSLNSDIGDLSDKFLIVLSLNNSYIEYAKNTILSLIRFHPKINIHLNLMDIKNVKQEKSKFLELYKNITFSFVNIKKNRTKKKKILSCLKDKPGWRNIVCDIKCSTHKYKDLTPKQLEDREKQFKKNNAGYYVNYFSTIVYNLINKTSKNILKLDCGLIINKNINDIFKVILENDVFLVSSDKDYIDRSINNNDDCYYNVIKQSFPGDKIEKSKINNDKMMGSILGVRNNENGKLFCKTFFTLNEKFYKADWFNDQILLNVCYNYHLQKSNMKFFIGDFRKYLNWNWDDGLKDSYIISAKGNRKRSKSYKTLLKDINQNHLLKSNTKIKTKNTEISFCIMTKEFSIEKLKNIIESIHIQKIPNYEIIICTSNYTNRTPSISKYISDNYIKLINVDEDIRTESLKKIKGDVPLIVKYADWEDKHLCWIIKPRVRRYGVGDYVNVEQGCGRVMNKHIFNGNLETFDITLENGGILKNLTNKEIIFEDTWRNSNLLSWRRRWKVTEKNKLNGIDPQDEYDAPFYNTLIDNISIYRKRKKLQDSAKYDIVVCLKDYVCLDKDWYANFLNYKSNNKIGILTNIIEENYTKQRYLDWISGYKMHYSDYTKQVLIVPYEYSHNKFVDKFNIYGVGALSIFNKNVYKGINFNEYLFEKNLDNLQRVTFSNGETYNFISDEVFQDNDINNYICLGLVELYNIIPVVKKKCKYAINKMSKCYVGKPNNRSLLKTASRFKNQELLDEIEQFSKINVKKKQGETN